MADTRQLHTLLRRIEQVKTWQLLILLLLCTMITLTFLRFTNINMVQRREAVLQADKQADSQALRNNLSALQRYSAEHMNTTRQPLYLQDSYNRDAKKAIELQGSSEAVNSGAIAHAVAICTSRHGGYSPAYVQCVVSEQANIPGSSGVQKKLELPNENLYRHTFYSPLWTPDFTGYSVLVCLFLSLLIIVRLVSLVILKILVKQRYSSV